MEPPTPPELSVRAVHSIVASIVFFTFICYLTIGMALAVLPLFVHGALGYGTVLAGVTVSAQYFASPINRASAGRRADSTGAKQTVITGLAACAVSALTLPVAAQLRSVPWESLAVLLVGRLLLGFGESWVGTGAIVWGIGRVGAANTARVISLNGMTTYGAIALGAPIGASLYNHFGLLGMGLRMAGLAAVGIVVAIPRQESEVVLGKRMPIRSVLGRVTPFGLALAAGSVGFGAISSFIALFYANQHWQNAAYALTAFGGMFVAVRLVFTQSIELHGGYRVAIACLVAETLGLAVLTWAPTALFATVGAGVSGAGMALLFPALGTEAIAFVPAASRGAALGVFNVFLDVCLGATGPLAGLLARATGFRSVYAFAAAAGGLGIALSAVLWRHSRKS
ncbi:MAG: MFS transporter [Fimbriimonadaceae bacterium]